MNPRARIGLIAALIATAIVVIVAVATGSRPSGPQAGQSARPTGSVPGCLEKPKPAKTPSWFPNDLPMPPDSFATEAVPAPAGLHRAVFSVKGDLRSFVVYALTNWKAQGWTLGRGDAEPGEAEDNFSKPGNRYGAFRAQSIYCDTGRTWVLVVLNDPKAKPQPVPSFTPTGPSKPLNTPT